MSLFGTFSPAAFAAAVTITWQGMLGIFAVMLLITALVSLFSRFSK